ncbi:hypothetical protein [Pontitalea aquivivens]|uniref:hypothetical protein n=1 Tax=Pontitalea aquivivens TaxID=3388663 RepID=UPI0039707EF8
MNQLGHNERSYRLDRLVADARRGLENVEKGEEFTIGGWLAYGHALNEGRALFPGDREFGEWVQANALRQVVGADGSLRDIHDPERAAAMWAAANADQFEQARQRGNPRTIRGIHAKWKEIEAEREAALFEQERQTRQEAERKAPVAAVEPARISAEAERTAEIGARRDLKTTPDAEALHAVVARAEAAEQASVIDAARASGPYAEARKKLTGLTREGLEDEVLGLRDALAEEQVRRRQAEAERDAWQAKFHQATSDSDLGRSLGLALRQRDTAKGRLGEEMAKNARLGRRIQSLEAELAKLQRSLEMQEIPL